MERERTGPVLMSPGTVPPSAVPAQGVAGSAAAPRRVASRVYFYCFPEKPPADSSYQHSLVGLAEGLRALGVEVHANIDYWRTGPGGEYLFRRDPAVGPDDCDAVVLEHIWFLHGYDFPADLFHRGRRYATVYIDRYDGEGKGKRTLTWDPAFRRFDLILKTHYNDRCAYPANVRPWAFGLTDRVLREAAARITEDAGAQRGRRRCLLVNFRVRHRLRKQIERELFPLLRAVLEIDTTVDAFDAPPSDAYHRLHWEQTGMRHYPGYFDRLAGSVACACFGGSFIPNWPSDAFAPVRRWHRPLNALSRAPRRLLQWDSWRFWESLAFGCATLHVDLEAHGARLPVMPENWRHYIGIDLGDPGAAVRRIADDPGLLDRIGKAGREWALAHYAPVPTARRFLETIGLGAPAATGAAGESGPRSILAPAGGTDHGRG